MKETILKFAPIWFQNLSITVYNCFLYYQRRRGAYEEKRRYFQNVESWSALEVSREQSRRLRDFLKWAKISSEWYKERTEGFALMDFPILEKRDILNNLKRIATIDESKAIVSLTGGTTGASMKVLYTEADVQERQALLDHFRESYGYKLGKRVAWFSGKSLVREKDLDSGLCYRDDWVNKIRFFSTFHIADRNFECYWSSLVRFSPEFIVGFPSSVYDICAMAKKRGLRFQGRVKVFFPTAETVLPVHREVIGEVLGCRLVDQYASSEGAPFVLECDAGVKHIHPLSGVFEVVDEDMLPVMEGEVLVTSFTTHGTPLIRYRIGDRIKLAPKDFKCRCGSAFPVVESIDGRTSDFILSPDNGRVNLGNISNCTKDVAGIVCFQVQQDRREKVIVKVVASEEFTEAEEIRFLSALSERLGSLEIELCRVENIEREKSGKFRIVKNSLPVD